MKQGLCREKFVLSIRFIKNLSLSIYGWNKLLRKKLVIELAVFVGTLQWLKLILNNDTQCR